MSRKAVLIPLLILFLVSACNLLGEGEDVSTPTPSLATVTPAATPGLQVTPGLTAPITTTETSSTFTIWIPPEIAAQAGAESLPFADQLLAFSANHPELETKLEQKPVGGPGGILSYLRTGHNVASGILPDLIALPTDQLTTAADEDLIFTLDGLMDPALFDDLYPAAIALARPGEQTIGYPFALTDLSHMAYKPSVVTTTLPLIWDQLASTINGSFVFPAAGDDGALLALQFYLAFGGDLTNEAGRPALQVDPLTLALEQLSLGRNNNFITLQSSNVTTLDESWRMFQEGAADLTPTEAELFLRERSVELTPGYAPLAGPNGALTPLVNGWVWALSTPDLTQKLLAIELITLLVTDPDYGRWSYQYNILPARRQAFGQWPPDDPYIAFLQQELERAHASPVSAGSNLIVVLGHAVFDVMSLTRTPQEAAENAVATLEP